MTEAHALPISDRTMCVYLRWEAATTPAELRSAREVVESIRGEPIGENGIRINITLPAGWDTGERLTPVYRPLAGTSRPG